MASPIPFIQPDENGQFYIDKKAMKILQSVKGAVSVICVAGPYRTGKSYLLNRLIYDETKQAGNEIQPNGFQVGNTVNACTKGIWLWSEPYYNPTTNTTYIFLDTEGLNSTGEEATFDTQIFSLSVLLASVFILNTSSAITESNLEQLELVAECSKKISFENVGDEDDDQVETQLALHFPRLIWVLRDFCLNLVDKENNPITPNQYLEGILAPISGGKRGAEEKNRIRRCIRDCFIKRECFPLPRPVNNESDLQKLQTIAFDKLRPEFTDGMRHLKMRSLLLYNHFKSPLSAPSAKQADTRKYINGNPVTGDVLLGMAQIYVDAINNGEVPTILSAWQSVLETKKLSVGQDYVTEMEDYLWSLVEPNQQQGGQGKNRRNSLGGRMGDGQQQQQQQGQREPELDANVITQKYDAKLKALFKTLGAHFPGDAESINSVQQLIVSKTEPVLEKVCAFANMHAAEYNKKLLKAILNQIHPHYKIANEAVFDQLAHWDPQSGIKPTNQAAATFAHMQFILEDFQSKAKGADKGAAIEKDLLFSLANKATSASHLSIVAIGTECLELQQKGEKLKHELEISKKDVLTARANVDRYQAQCVELQTSISNLREEREKTVSKLREEMMVFKSEAQNENNQLLLKNDRLETKLNHTHETLQETITEKKSLQDKVKSLGSQLEMATANHSSSETKFAKADSENKGLGQRIADLNSRIAQLQAEYKQLNNAAQYSKEQLHEKETHLKNVEGALEKLDNAHKSTKKHNQDLLDQVETFRLQLVAAEKALAKHGDTDEMVNTVQAEMKKVQRTNEHLTKENQSLEATKAHLTQKVSQLEQDLSDLQHAKLSQSILQATKRPSIDYSGHMNKKSRQSEDSYDQFDDAVGHFDDDADDADYHNNQSTQDDYHPTPKRGSGAFVQLNKGSKVSGKGQKNEDDELDRVAQKEARRRTTVSHMDSDDSEAGSDDEDQAPKKRTPKKTQSGWSQPLDFSPAKIPDQAKILERRRRDGSIFAGNEDDEDSEEEIRPVVQKKIFKKAPKAISSRFKEAAKASYLDDDEAEYQRLKALQSRKKNSMEDSDEEEEPASRPTSKSTKTSKLSKNGPTIPPGAPAVLPTKVENLTKPDLCKWLDAFGTSYSKSAAKGVLVNLVKAVDPRFD